MTAFHGIDLSSFRSTRDRTSRLLSMDDTFREASAAKHCGRRGRLESTLGSDIRWYSFINDTATICDSNVTAIPEYSQAIMKSVQHHIVDLAVREHRVVHRTQQKAIPMRLAIFIWVLPIVFSIADFLRTLLYKKRR